MKELPKLEVTKDQISSCHSQKLPGCKICHLSVARQQHNIIDPTGQKLPERLWIKFLGHNKPEPCNSYPTFDLTLVINCWSFMPTAIPNPFRYARSLFC